MQDRKTRFWLSVIVFGVVVLVVAWSSLVFARDLGQWSNEDASKREWYQSLMQPDIPTASCCGEADAYFCDDYRAKDGKAYCAISDERPDEPRQRPHIDVGTVIEIPTNKLKWDRGNPEGRGIIFLSRAGYVFCYVQAGGV